MTWEWKYFYAKTDFHGAGFFGYCDNLCFAISLCNYDFFLMILHTTTMLMAVEKQTKTTHRRRIREGITDQKYAEYIANTPH